MAVVDGLRFEKVGLTARLQSNSSVRSWLAQYFRSSSSLAKRGRSDLLFFALFFIDSPLPSTHVACRNDTQKGLSDGEYDRQAAPSIGLAKGCKAHLCNGVLFVRRDDDRPIEERL